MQTAEEKLGYPLSERTRFKVRVEILHPFDETPAVEWIRHCRTLEEAQRGYISLREITGLGMSGFGFGQVFDEAGQEIAHISYNGRLWAPGADGRSPWEPRAIAVAEAPEPLPLVSGSVLRRMEKYRLIQTCGACPESYTVFLGWEEVGHLRLRHGLFRAEARDETVYEAEPRGDGIFDPDERDHYMHEAILRIDAAVDPRSEHGRLDPDEAVPEIAPRDGNDPAF